MLEVKVNITLEPMVLRIPFHHWNVCPKNAHSMHVRNNHISESPMRIYED